MSVVGYGIGGALGMGTESTPGTAVAPSIYVPIMSESIKATRDIVESGSITGDRSRRKLLEGLRMGGGDFQMEVDGSTFGLPLHYVNGSASGGTTSAAMTGLIILSAPTGSATAGGTLTAGAYRYKVATVYNRTATGDKYVAPASASVTITTATTNLTATLAFTDPTTLTPPDGWTVAGTAVYRSAIAGGVGTETFLAYQSGTAAGYADDGSVTPDTAVLPVSATMYRHIFTRAYTSGENPLPPFSTTIVKDNDYSQRFSLCRMNGMEISLADGNSPVTCKFSLLARDYEKIANPSPSITNLRKFMSWTATIAIDGTADETVESLTLKINNNADRVPGLRGVAANRDVGYGRKQVSLDVSRSFQTHTLWDKMKAATRFAISAWCVGQGVVETASTITISSGVYATPLPYMMRIYAPSCLIGEAGANINGPGRMVEQLPIQAEVDNTLGYELRIELFNLTASYA